MRKDIIKLLMIFPVLFISLLGCSKAPSEQKTSKKIEFYSEIIEIVHESRKMDFYNKIAKAYEEVGNSKKAEELRQKFMESMKIRFSESEISEGYLRSNYETIINLCNKYIAADPGLVTAYIEKASSYMALQDPTKAFEVINEAIDLDSENPDAYVLRSAMYFKTGQNNKSQMDEQKAIELETKK